MEGDASQVSACALCRGLQSPCFTTVLTQQRVAVAENYPPSVFVSEMDSNTGLIRLRLNFPVVATINGMKNKPAISALRCDCPPYLTVDKVYVGDVCHRGSSLLDFPRFTTIRGMHKLPNRCAEPSHFSI